MAAAAARTAIPLYCGPVSAFKSLSTETILDYDHVNIIKQ